MDILEQSNWYEVWHIILSQSLVWYLKRVTSNRISDWDALTIFLSRYALRSFMDWISLFSDMLLALWFFIFWGFSLVKYSGFPGLCCMICLEVHLVSQWPWSRIIWAQQLSRTIFKSALRKNKADELLDVICSGICIVWQVSYFFGTPGRHCLSIFPNSREKLFMCVPFTRGFYFWWSDQSNFCISNLGVVYIFNEFHFIRVAVAEKSASMYDYHDDITHIC